MEVEVKAKQRFNFTFGLVSTMEASCKLSRCRLPIVIDHSCQLVDSVTLAMMNLVIVPTI